MTGGCVVVLPAVMLPVALSPTVELPPLGSVSSVSALPPPPPPPKQPLASMAVRSINTGDARSIGPERVDGMTWIVETAMDGRTEGAQPHVPVDDLPAA